MDLKYFPKAPMTGTKKNRDKKVNFKNLMIREEQSPVIRLTLQRPMFLSYKNQSVHLQSKSTDWFLYDGDIAR